MERIYNLGMFKLFVDSCFEIIPRSKLPLIIISQSYPARIQVPFKRPTKHYKIH